MPLYCDGGVIGMNPSSIGGTWAFVIVGQEDQEIYRASGIVTPKMIGLPYVTNNFTELYAAVMALNEAPPGWNGTIFTDSQVTLRRLVNKNAKMNGITPSLQRMLREVVEKCGQFEAVLLNGHPTKADLERRIGSRGLPVSKWNVVCDELCNQEANIFKKQQAERFVKQCE